MTQTKILSLFLSFCLILEQSVFAQTIDLSHYFARNSALAISQSDKFRPLHLRYISYDNQANDFKLLLDKGNFFNQKTEKPKNEKTLELEKTTQELMKYFFIGLSLPNEKFWVNLRPDSPNNILDPDLEKTDIGRIFLEADLQLKKDTSGMTSPQTKEGKDYWDKLYKKAGELFGSENTTIPTLTRPWIVPDEVILRESPEGAYIYKATLKVMLEEDYLSRGGFEPAPTYQQYAFNDPRLKELNEYSTQLIKESIIPRLTKEINSARRYAPLRQVYYSLILAQWFKQKYGSSGSVRATGTSAPVSNYVDLIDSGNLADLASSQPYDKQTYFQQYQNSFQDGEYNLQEPVYMPTGQSVRRYMSGGITMPISEVTHKIPGSGSPMLSWPSAIKKHTLYFLATLPLTIFSGSDLQTNMFEVLRPASFPKDGYSDPAIDMPEEIDFVLSDIIDMKLKTGIDKKFYKIKNKPVYYIMFASREIQKDVFNRLGAFTQSYIFSGKILSDEQIDDTIKKRELISAIGHNYLIKDICKFYNEIRGRYSMLNSSEKQFLEALLRFGAIELKDGLYKPTNTMKIIISMAGDIGDENIRKNTFAHEWRHALFEIYPAIREAVENALKNIPPDQRDKIINAVHMLAGYDITNNYLMLSEIYAIFLDPDSYITLPTVPYINHPSLPNKGIVEELRTNFKNIEFDVLRKEAIKNMFMNEDISKRIKSFPNVLRLKDTIKGGESNQPATIKNSPSSAAENAEASSSLLDKKGGIDLSRINKSMRTESAASPGASGLNSLADVDFNVNDELIQLQKLLNAKIIPSADRLNRYARAARASSAFSPDSADSALSLVAETFRLQEEKAIPAPAELKALAAWLEQAG